MKIQIKGSMFLKKGYWKDILETGILLLLFYRFCWFAVLAGIPVCLLAFRRRKRKWERERCWQMNLEFREGLQGIAAALEAGYALENALTEAKHDLFVLYGRDCVLGEEFEKMEKKLALNQPVEAVFEELGEKSGIEDIRSYAQVLRIAGRTGGNLIEITRGSAQKIGERIALKREIKTMVAGKQMEGKIMNTIPLAMIAYFWLCSPGFLDFYYETLSGQIYMTVFLVLYLGAREWNRRICSIAQTG